LIVIINLWRWDFVVDGNTVDLPLEGLAGGELTAIATGKMVSWKMSARAGPEPAGSSDLWPTAEMTGRLRVGHWPLGGNGWVQDASAYGGIDAECNTPNGCCRDTDTESTIE
jgi:hypothetical protein